MWLANFCFPLCCFIVSHLIKACLIRQDTKHFAKAVLLSDKDINLLPDTRHLTYLNDRSSCLLILVQKSIHQVLHVRAPFIRQWVQLLVDDLLLQLLDVFAVEWLPEEEKLVDDDTHCPDVGLGVVWELKANLWWPEVWSTAQRSGHVRLMAQCFGDTKVTEFEDPILDENILSLDVTMQDGLAV